MKSFILAALALVSTGARGQALPPAPVVVQAPSTPATPAPATTPVVPMPATPPAAHPNRVVLWAGYGPDGLTVFPQNGETIIRPYQGALVGVSYAHSLWDRTSVNAMLIRGMALQSPTYIWLGGFGYDF